MALVDPNIAMGYKGIELPNQLAQYGQIAQIQNAQNQNQLAQYQLGSAQRADVASNALNKAYQDNTNPNTGEVDFAGINRSLASAGAGSQIPGQLKAQSELAAARTTRDKAQAELVDARLKQSRQMLGNVNPNDPTAATQLIAWNNASHADPVLGPVLKSNGFSPENFNSMVTAAAAKGPQAIADLLLRSQVGVEKFADLNKPTVSTRNLGKTTETSLISPMTGEVRKVATETNTIAPADAERIKLEGDRIGLEGRRVAVAEETQRRDADPEFQRRMAGAKAVGEAIAKGDVAAQQALPKIINRAEEGLRLIDELVGKPATRDKNGKVTQSGTAPHAGFNSAVGATWFPGARFVPGTDAADFMARFDQLKGASFLEAFESLKGGGAITETEGTKATSAINRMSTAQSEKEFMSAARDLQSVIHKGVTIAQTRAAKAGAPAIADPLGIR